MKRLLRAIDYLYIFIFAICALFTLVHVERYPLGFPHSVVKTLLFALVPAGILWLTDWCMKALPSPKNDRLLWALVCLVMGAELLVVLKVATPVGWDSFELTYAAENGISNWRYFATYPNNLLPEMLLAAWVRLTAWVPMSAYRRMLVLNLFLVDASVLLLFSVVKALRGKREARLALVLGLLVIGIDPALSVVYTDTMAIFFPIAYFACLVKAYRTEGKSGWLWYGAAGLCLTIGILVKPTVIMIGIAGFMWLVLEKGAGRSLKYWAAAIGIGFLAAAGAYLVVQQVEAPVQAELERQEPEVRSKGILHYISMGLTNTDDDPSGFGGYTQSEVDWTNAHINDENYKEEALQHIVERVEEYGFFGMLGHFFDKLVWAGSDGTFFYGLEGGFHTEEQAPQDTLRGKLQNAFYIESPFYQNLFASWMQGAWLYVCVLSVVSAWKNNEQKGERITRLSVIGLFVFLMLMENRSRYLFLYLPVILSAIDYRIPSTILKADRGSKE